MQNQERLESGEKTFVATFVLAFVVEVILAGSSALAGGPAWVGALVSTFCGCFVLYLANRLYGGDREAANLARIWVLAMLALGAVGLILALIGQGAPGAGRFIGMVALWAAVLKIVAYLILGSSLLLAGSSRYFVTVRTGGTVTEEERVADEPVASGAALKLSAQQAAPISDLSWSLNCASITLCLVGVLALANAAKDGLSVQAVPDELRVQTRQTACLLLGQGVLALLLGGLLRRPTAAVRDIEENNADTGYIVSALVVLKGLFVQHLVVTVLFVALAAVQLLLWIPRSGQ